MNLSKSLSRFSLIVCVLMGISVARAQTDESLVIKPWPEGRIFEGRASAMLFDQANVDSDPGGMSLVQVESSSRVRLSTKYPVGPSIGYDYLLLSMSGDHQPIPDQLTDISIGVGTPFTKLGDWFLMAGEGVGYAGDNAFGNDEAWYGKAWIGAGRELSKTSQILVLVDYDGNRNIYPDLPMPGVVYHKTLNDKLDITLGPIMGATWKPIDRVTIDVAYIIPSRLNVLAKYEPNDQWTIFAQYVDKRYAFHVDELPDHRRLFFEQKRVEAGVTFAPVKWASLTLAGGYAFDQNFDSGWDIRDLDTVADVGDAAYVRFGLEVRY